jgi:hypothetical protein
MCPSLSFRCPACHARFKAPPRLAGQSRPCPRCGQPVVVVRCQVPPSSGPLLVGDSHHGTAAPWAKPS